jgi:hypothetical protein
VSSWQREFIWSLEWQAIDFLYFSKWFEKELNFSPYFHDKTGVFFHHKTVKMAKRSPIKVSLSSIIVAILLSWAAFASVQELMSEFKS